MITILSRFLKPDLAQYPYLNPPVFFSTGEAVASVAILLAIYQFRSEKWLIVLKVRNYIQKTVYTAMSLGIAIAIASSFILIKDPTNIIQLSIFWQALASLLIVFSIVFLLIKTTNKGLFVANPRRFYEVMHWELARANPERLEVILDVLLENLNDICGSASQNPQSPIAKQAIAILDVILGDGSLIDAITTKRLDALSYILAIIEKNNLNHLQARGIPLIVKNLFVDKNSFLYKHLEKSGLALSSNSYELVFGSAKLLANFDLFGWPTLDYKMQEGLNNKQITVLIEALSKAMETYLKTGTVPPRRINNGLSHLSKIYKNLCMKIATEEQRGTDTKYSLKDEWWSLHTIGNFLGHDYVFLAYQDNLNQELVNNEKIASQASFHSDSTINDGVAASLYTAFESLSYIKEANDIYYNVLELLHGMMYEYQYKEGYRTPFDKRMWGQIARNVLKGYWPATLKTYLIPVGFSLAADENQRKGWMGEQAERMRRLLYVDLKPLLNRNKKMADKKTPMKTALLPDYMTYKNGKFTYTLGFGKGRKKIIAPPPRNSKSALEGVDPEDRLFWGTDTI
jgi:hypothetical protein